MDILSDLQDLDYKIDIDTAQARDDHDYLIEDLDATLNGRLAAVDHFWKQEDWDYFQVVVTGTDRIMHYIWAAYEDASHPHHQAFVDYFGKVDAFIGALYDRFSGDSGRPYREGDAAAPVNVYGETKLEGERALAASGAVHLIFRTSWVYGVRGQNFLLTMRRLLRERDELQVVDDQVGAPTWSRMLAEATAQVVGRALYAGLDLHALSGVYHMTAAGSTSWYGFARAILEGSGLDCRIKPIPTSGYPTPARRPAYSVLDNDRLLQTFGLALPDWRIGLAQCLDDLRERE